MLFGSKAVCLIIFIILIRIYSTIYVNDSLPLFLFNLSLAWIVQNIGISEYCWTEDVQQGVAQGTPQLRGFNQKSFK